MSRETPPPRPLDGRRAVAFLAAAAVVFAAFLAFSAVRAPAPAVNEPHYLGKAKRFWDASYAPGDLFLDSSNPHLVFYVAVGWPTRFLSLTATAWLGRILGYGLLAAGWTLLARRLTGSVFAAVPAAAIFLLLASLGNLSGEWLVGGIESKTFAYGLLFAGWAWWLDGRPKLAAVALGGAVSFHPVVGVWGTGCAVAAELVVRRREGNSIAIRPLLATGAVFLVAALPGLVPAVLSLGGTDAAGAARATYLQVFQRLRHHLDPTTFRPQAFAAYGLMLAGGLVLCFRRPADREAEPVRDRFAGLVLAAVAVAVVGTAVGWHVGSAWTMPLRDLRGTLLKFYPFRLADVLVPTAFAFAVAATLMRRGSGLRPATLPAVAAAGCLAVALLVPAIDRDPTRLPRPRKAAWLAACGWIERHTPADALVIASPRAWGFKWYARRAEYVSLKDAPQDAAGLLEWERRLGVLGEWWAKPGGVFAAADLQRLGDRTDADWLLTGYGADRFLTEPAYDDGFYRVYRLR